MRYHVTFGHDTASPPIAIEVHDLPSGALEVRIGDRPVDVDVVDLGGAQLSVRIDGRVVDLTTEGSPPELGAVASGQRSYVRVESDRQRAADAAKRGTRGANEKIALSPMPGRVVKLFVAPGDEVTQGQPLLVMEAMKMENEIRAKAKGTVAEIHVRPGDAVEGNAKLITLA